MKKPTVEELSNNGKYNRYTLVIATSKFARQLTDEIKERMDTLDTSLLADREESRKLSEIRDEKPLKTSIEMFAKGDYHIVDSSLDENATN